MKAPDRRADALERWKDGWRDLAPFVLVAIAVLFNLIALRAETISVQAANDTEHHLLMIRWAEQRISSGHLPFDGWYPLNLGSPHFHHYQSFPHIVAGLFAVVFGAPTVYQWSLYLLLSLWPLCVYWSGRIFGASRWIAATAALVSLLMVSVRMNALGFEYAAYIRAGFGVWAQLWGMWFLPLALALTWRTVNRDGSYVWPSLALAGLLASHFITAYLGLLVLGAWVFIGRQGFVRRAKRTAVVVLGGFLLGGWAVLPALFDAQWATRQENLPDFYLASFGPAKVLGWLVSGELFDSGRLPVITLLVAVGVVVCIRRWRDERARALLVAGGLSLVMYMGRSVVGPVLDRLPIGVELPLHRFIEGVHLAGVFLAAVGGVWIVAELSRALADKVPDLWRRAALRKAQRRWNVTPRELTAAALVVVGVVLLLPAFVERWSFAATGRAAIERRRSIDAGIGRDVAELIDIAKRKRDGRVYAGLSERTGETNEIEGIPLYLLLARNNVDAIGYKERTLSLGQNVEGLFNDLHAAHYDLFNVRYELSMFPPAVEADVIARRGTLALWRIETSGYLDVVDTLGTVRADRTNLGAVMARFMRSELPDRRLLPTVAFGDRPAARPTVTGKLPETRAGRVRDQSANPDGGVFEGRISARRRAVVLLKSSFDPRWRVTVDGERVEPELIAPAFVGAVVPKGEHTVRFEYIPLRYGPLFALSLLALAALVLMPRSVETRKRRRADAG